MLAAEVTIRCFSTRKKNTRRCYAFSSQNKSVYCEPCILFYKFQMTVDDYNSFFSEDFTIKF